MCMGGTVTQTPENESIIDQGETATTAPTAVGTVTATISQHIPPL